jgi:hypothetical protein
VQRCRLPKIIDLGLAKAVSEPSFQTAISTSGGPLVREYFGEQLRSQRTEAWKECNKRLYHYYRTLAPQLPESFRDMEPLLKFAGRVGTGFSEKLLRSLFELGLGFAECHHITPLTLLNKPIKTKLEDLAIVRANCHLMMHRGKQWKQSPSLKLFCWDENERNSARTITGHERPQVGCRYLLLSLASRDRPIWLKAEDS